MLLPVYLAIASLLTLSTKTSTKALCISGLFAFCPQQDSPARIFSPRNFERLHLWPVLIALISEAPSGSPLHHCIVIVAAVAAVANSNLGFLQAYGPQNLLRGPNMSSTSRTYLLSKLMFHIFGQFSNYPLYPPLHYCLI